MRPLYFTFPQATALQIETEWLPARDFFAAEYAFHRTDKLDRNLPLLRVLLQTRQEPGWVTHRHKLLARWNYNIHIEPQTITLQASGNRWAIPMIHHMLIHPSLRWLSARNGNLLLHAGAVARKGYSILFTGKGGAGKTTLTSLLLSTGRWQIHADDYVFVRPGEGSHAYITRAHLYRPLLRWVPEIAARLTAPQRLQLEILGRIRAWSGERLKWPVRLSFARLWPHLEIAPQARPAALLLLEQSAAFRLTPLEASPSVIQSLLQMNFHEARHYVALLQKSGIASADWLTDWQNQEAQLLAKLCQEVPLYRLEVPGAQTMQRARETFFALIENLLA